MVPVISGHWDKLPKHAPNAAVWALTKAIKAALAHLFYAHDAVHLQIGRTCKYRDSPDVAAHKLVAALKTALDPQGKMVSRPSGNVTGSNPPLASRCGSSNKSSGRDMGAKGRPDPSSLAIIWARGSVVRRASYVENSIDDIAMEPTAPPPALRQAGLCRGGKRTKNQIAPGYAPHGPTVAMVMKNGMKSTHSIFLDLENYSGSDHNFVAKAAFAVAKSAAVRFKGKMSEAPIMRRYQAILEMKDRIDA